MSKSLSKRAQKLLTRVQQPRYWYRAYGSSIPKAMQELFDAGLVEIAVRRPTIAAYYVPRGFKNRDPEIWPKVKG